MKTYFLMLAALLITSPSNATWTTSTKVDEMSGDTSYYAMSPSAKTTSPMSFPYQETTSKIVVGCAGASSWSYLYFSTAPNISNAETKSGYNVVRTRIRWDSNEVETAEYKQDWGSNFLFPYDFLSSEFIPKVKESNTLLVELRWHGQNRPRFRYSMAGSSKAIAHIESKCAPAAKIERARQEEARAAAAEQRVRELEQKAREQEQKARDAQEAQSAYADIQCASLQLKGGVWGTTSHKRLYEVLVGNYSIASQKSTTPPKFSIGPEALEKLSGTAVITVRTSSLYPDGRTATTTTRSVSIEDQIDNISACTGKQNSPSSPRENPDPDDTGDRVPTDLTATGDDDLIAKTLREAAIAENDPVLRDKLWEEYRKYRGLK